VDRLPRPSPTLFIAQVNQETCQPRFAYVRARHSTAHGIDAGRADQSLERFDGAKRHLQVFISPTQPRSAESHAKGPEYVPETLDCSTFEAGALRGRSGSVTDPQNEPVYQLTVSPATAREECGLQVRTACRRCGFSARWKRWPLRVNSPIQSPSFWTEVPDQFTQ
jgi:hypothetical protein